MRKYLKIIDQNRADKGLRFANLVIDRIATYAFIFLFHLLLGIIYQFTLFPALEKYFMWIDQMGKLEDFLFTTSIFLIYYFVIEYFTKGRTIGKYITGTKTISIDGKTPTTEQILLRTLSRAVPFDALSFLGENGWHDSWSDTRVIKIKNYEEAQHQKEEINAIGKNYE